MSADLHHLKYLLSDREKSFLKCASVTFVDVNQKEKRRLLHLHM